MTKKNILVKGRSFRCPIEMSNAIDDLSDQSNLHASQIIRDAIKFYLSHVGDSPAKNTSGRSQ